MSLLVVVLLIGCLQFGLLSCSDLDASEVYGSLSFVTEESLSITDLKVNESSLLNTTDIIIKTKCTKEEALKVFYNALNAPLSPYPVAIVSGVCSEATEIVAAVSKHYCLPMISYSISLEFPGDEDKIPHLFSVVPSDYYFAVGAVHLISYYKWQRAVVITQDEEHHKRTMEDLLTLLEGSNIYVVSNSLLPTSRLQNVNLFPPDVRIIVLNMDLDKAKVVFCQALRQNVWNDGQYPYVWIIPGWYADRWWTLGETVVLDNFTCNSTDLARFLVQQGVIAISHYPGSTSLEDGACIQNDVMKALIHDAKQTIIHGLNLTVVEKGSGGIHSRKDTSLICSPEVDDCFNMILGNIKSTTFQGDSGSIEFDETGSRIPVVVNLFQYREIDRCKVHVAVINITSNPVSVEFVNDNDMLWVGGVPSDGTPRTKEDFIPLWLTVTANIWSGLVIVGSIIYITFTCIFRKRKLVRLTSPNLNYIIAIGVITFNIGGMLFVNPQVPIGILEVFCSVRAWLVSIGISLCFITIDVKMWRIYYIFHDPNPSKRKKVFQDWHLFLLVMFCVMVDVIILTVASAVDSARSKPVETNDVRHNTIIDEDGITLNYTVFLCTSHRKLIWLALLFGYKAVIQVIGLVLSLRIRNIKIEVLNDSKEIAMSIYLSSATLAVVIIVSVVLRENLTIYGATYAYGTALSTTTVIIIVFFTKMYKLYKDPLGEKIFTCDNAVSAVSASALPAAGGVTLNSSLKLVDNNDQIHFLENKLRQVEMELRKYRDGETMIQEEKVNGHDLHSQENSKLGSKQNQHVTFTIATSSSDIAMESETR